MVILVNWNMYKNWKYPSAFFFHCKNNCFHSCFNYPISFSNYYWVLYLFFGNFFFCLQNLLAYHVLLSNFSFQVQFFYFWHIIIIFLHFTQRVQFLGPAFSFCEGICETLELQFYVTVFSICLLLFLKGFKNFIYSCIVLYEIAY